MKESKLSYIALALSVGAAALSGVSGMLSVLPNSNKIDVLTEQVQVLTEKNKQLIGMVGDVDMNRLKINELDIGMTAFANVMNIDRRELAKAINTLKARQAADALAAKAPRQPSEDKGNLATVQQVNHQPVHVVSVDKATQEAPEQANSIAAIKTSASAPSQQHSKPAQLTEAARHTSGASNSATPLMGADNPFLAGLDNSSAGGDAAQSIAETPALAKSMTIAQVDAVLGKRLSSSWYKPAGEIDGLSTLIQLKMTRNGKVATARIAKSSGNSIFDNSALSAAKSIGTIEEVGQLSDADFQKAYESRPIQFTPQMGR